MSGAWRAVSALLLAVTSGGGMLASVMPTREEFSKTYALCPNGRVVVENLYGDVVISAWDRNEIRIQAIKSGSDPRRLSDARIVVDSSSSQVSIRTLYAASSDQPANVEYRITAPRTASLENIKLVNGGLSITGMAGAVKASAVNGDIKAERLGGETDLSTVNGKLEIAFERVGRAHPISLSSVNGPISISLPPEADASLEARNLSGGIEADLKRVWRALDGHTLRGVLNRGGTRVRLDNINGGISIRSTCDRQGAPAIRRTNS